MSGLVNKKPKEQPVAAPVETIYDKIYAAAKSKFGEKEIPGNKDNPFILECFKTTSYKADHDETAWCAAFIGWVLKQVGLKGSGSAAAVSYLKWGVELKVPVKGCIMVLQHPSGGHHVTIFDREENGRVYGLGGNQSNQVNVSSWAKSEVMKGGYRGPA